MATTTQEAERTQSLMAALDLRNEEGDSLIGDVEEAIGQARTALRRLNLHRQNQRLGTIRQGFSAWDDSVSQFQATDAQLRLAQTQESSTWHTLVHMKRAAQQITEQVSDAANRDGAFNADAIERHLTRLDASVHDLNDYFPDTRRQPNTADNNASPPPQRSSNVPNWVNSDIFRTDTSRSQSTSASPPPQRAESNYSHTGPNPRRSSARQQSTFSNSGSEPRSEIIYEEVNVTDRGFFHGGNRYQSPEDASLRRSESRRYEVVNISGGSFGHLGDSYGAQDYVQYPQNSNTGRRQTGTN